MRILIVTRALPAHGDGGLESVAWDLACAFRRLGAEVRVLTTCHADLPSEGVVAGVRVLTVEAPPGRYSRAWWRGSAALFARDLRHETDAVLSVSAAGDSLATPPRRRGDPVRVFQAHGTSSGEIVSKLRSGSPKAWAGAGRNLCWGLFRDRAYRRHDAIVAVGARVARQLARPPTRWLVGRTPVVLIENGVDAERFRFGAQARSLIRNLYGVGEDARLLLSLGRLHRQKGVHLTLTAFVQAAAAVPDLMLAIVGEGPERAALQAMATAAGLEHRVRFVGGVSRTDVPAWLSAADALVFPTLRVEGAPVAVLEALATGLPVIASTGIAEPHLPTRQVDPRDPKALALILKQTAPTVGPRRSLLPDTHSLDFAANKYMDLFQHLIDSRAA